MNSNKDNCCVTSDDSEEEEDICDNTSAQSPPINVTDNEEEKDNGQKVVQLDADHLKPGSKRRIDTGITDQAASADISLELLSSISALSDTVNTQLDFDDLKQLENDKKAVYSHPLFPLLALLFEKCEIATRSINSFDSDPSLSAFNGEIEEFIEHQQKGGKPFFSDNPEVDSLMIRSIQVFRIHLLELEKVSELCKDFCKRYTSCLKSKMRSEVLLRGSSENQTKANSELESGLESSPPLLDINSSFLSCSVSSMSSVCSSSSITCSSPASANPSPPSSPSLSSSSSVRSSHHTSNPSPDLSVICPAKSSPQPYAGISFEQVIKPFLRLSTPKFNMFNGNLMENDSNLSQPDDDNMVAHDLSVKKQSNSNNSSPVDNAPRALNVEKLASTNETEDTVENVKKTTTKVKRQTSEKSGGNHSKRGVLPKQATSIMRSWLFQHIVHPYPTEDEKRAIASQTNLTLLQVNNWFINARRRILQPMLDSANTMHHELISGNVQELDLSAKSKPVAVGASKKLKTNSQPLNRFWPQSLANIIQRNDLNSKS